MRLSLCLLLFAACGGEFDSDFPMGLEPLEKNEAPQPTPQGGDQYPETLTFASGNLIENNQVVYKWVHSRGYIKAPITDVYAAIKVPAVVASKRQDPDYTFVEGNEPDYDHSILFSYSVEDLVTVEWDEQWRYGVIEGTVAAPTLAVERHQKVAGTDFIGILEGSMTLTKIDDNTTAYENISHLKAAGGTISQMMMGAQDRYDAMVAQSKGQPLPEVP